jgi:hypothetical protein
MLPSDDSVDPNEANLPDCFPESPYEKAYFEQRYISHWKQFHSRKKDSNWHRFHLKLILLVYLSIPKSWLTGRIWKAYLSLRIRWSLLTGQGYLRKDADLA